MDVFGSGAMWGSIEKPPSQLHNHEKKIYVRAMRYNQLPHIWFIIPFFHHANIF